MDGGPTGLVILFVIGGVGHVLSMIIKDLSVVSMFCLCVRYVVSALSCADDIVAWSFM